MPKFHALIFLIILVMSGCSPRGEMVFLDVPSATNLQRVHVATEREVFSTDENLFGEQRSTKMRFGVAEVSIPPNHKRGSIEWPRGKPDAKRHFVTHSKTRYRSQDSFVASVQDLQSVQDETMIFVHGFNVTNAEAVYRVAQIKNDYDINGEAVLYSWPSAGHPAGYVYDRDSVFFSRDGLETLIRALTNAPDRKVFLVAHSMGSQLVMETLRQLSLLGDKRTLSRISAVVLMSPDIDPDVFRRQFERIDPAPERTVIFTNSSDRALGVSGFLTRKKNRLGAITDTTKLQGLPVTVVDLSNISDGDRSNHNVAATSPSAIRFLDGLLADGTLEPRSKVRVIRAPLRTNAAR